MTVLNPVRPSSTALNLSEPDDDCKGPAPVATIVIPAWNAQATIAETLASALDQSYENFEIVVIDDGSTDATARIVQQFSDPRLRLIQKENGGLNSARNAGIRHARGRYIGFLDADDLWHRDKLARHVEHLDACPDVGLSYGPSVLIDGEGRNLGLAQNPAPGRITAADIFARNPVGNGSAALLRRSALQSIAFCDPERGNHVQYFDEDLVQSTDVECWLRLSLTTGWAIEGIGGLLVSYRTHRGGLSANIPRQLETWKIMVAKTALYAPDFIKQHTPRARAYQLRYLARRAVNLRAPDVAWPMFRDACASYPAMLREEPAKTLTTAGAALVLKLLGARGYAGLERAVLLFRRKPA